MCFNYSIKVASRTSVVAIGLFCGWGSPAAAAIVAHWTLDDGESNPTSTTAVDSVALPSNLVWQNVTTPRWIEGALSGAAGFGGSASSSDRDDVLAAVPVLGDTKLDIVGALTISAWVNYAELGGGTSTRHIAGKDQSGGATGDAFSLKHNMSSSANTLQFMIASGGANINLTSATSLTNYTNVSQNSGWVHVVGVFEPSQFMRLYIDGTLDNQLTSGVPASIDSFPTTQFTIGRLYNPAGNNNSFQGSIDDVQIYGQALDGTQIGTLFANPGQGQTGLVGHWTLDDGQSNANSVTAIDAVAPSANGTWQNVTPPRWTTGLSGGAANFGGAASPAAEAAKRDDVIAVIPSVAESKLDITGALSIAAWIKSEEYGSSLSTRHIAGKDQTSGPEGDAYSLKHQMSAANNDTLQFLIAENGVNTNLVSTKTLTNFTAESQRDGWIHVTGVFQPGEYMRLYIDGELDIENTVGVPTEIDLITSTPFTIGRLHGSTTHSFNGGIDDVRLYDHALSLAEIEALVAMVPIVSDGDFNDDGFVDAADYVVWRKTMGDTERYEAWRSHFGESTGGAASVTLTPEPNALLLVVLMVLALFPLQSRARRKTSSV